MNIGNFLVPANVIREEYRKLFKANDGGYDGTSKKHLLSNWDTSSSNTDAILYHDSRNIRNRSSDLIRNNPIAAGIINTKVTSVVGSGIKVGPAIKRNFFKNN